MARTFCAVTRCCLKDDYRSDLVQDQQNYENILSGLAKKAGTLPDEASIESLLASSVGTGMQIELLDPAGHSVWSTGKVPSEEKLSAKDYIVTDGKIRYGLRLSAIFDPRGEVYRRYQTKYRGMIFPSFVVLFLLISWMIDHSIIKPIYALYRRMEEDPLKMEVAEKKYRRDEIGTLEQHFDDMVRNLQTADRQQQTMLAAISHDLKTPLTSILTYTDRLTTGKVADDGRRLHYYRVIQQKAEDIRRLIENFQDACRIVELNIKAEDELILAASFWKSVFGPYTEEWDDVDAKLEYVSTIEENAMFRGDRASLRRVAANIMGNAVKYGAHPLLVHVELTREENRMILKVENNGTEVPEEKLPLLFDRFYRAEPSRSQAGGGSGLGLYICRTIIEKHGGAIRAYKPESRNFGIEISLPLVKS